MNRIYQGRVSFVEVPKPDAKNEWQPLDPDPKIAKQMGEEALWRHHELFQDAVNYYIVALASLGDSQGSKLTKLRGLLNEVWLAFDKKGNRRSGMGESLQRAWQMEYAPSLLEAVERFQKPLQEHGVTGQEMELAGESLAHDLGGEGSIQKGGTEYWPYFCQSGFLRGVTFPRSAEQTAKEMAQTKMPEWVWSVDTNVEISRLHENLTQAHFCNVVPEGGVLDDDARKKLFGIALSFLRTAGLINEEQKNRWTAVAEITACNIAAYAGGSINKAALKARFYAFLIFKHLSSDKDGLTVLRAVYPKPDARKVAIDPVEDSDETRFRALGDDPIKLVRDKAKIVFRAFTALPLWRNPKPELKLHERSDYCREIAQGELHAVAWKDFDIAAFKEALKVYNQFQQNEKKREAKLDALAAKLLVMDGERAIEGYASDTDADRRLQARLARIWKNTEGKPKLPAGDNGEETTVARFAGDARIDRLRVIINADLAEEYRLTDGRTTPYGLRRRTMKGWSEVKRRWQALARNGTAFSEGKRAKLKAELDELRGGEKREQIGSHRLFEALLKDEAAWTIWREPDEKLADQITKKGWATDPLEAFREYCETREAYEDISGRPLNFTPADARYSRRLFMFTDTCSFGNDRGEYRHDAKTQAVTVPVAWKDETGRYSMQPRRLAYSAPRLLRDRIRAEDGGYAQDWTQPMMRALFGATDQQPNLQELKDAAVQLMPDYDGKGLKWTPLVGQRGTVHINQTGTVQHVQETTPA